MPDELPADLRCLGGQGAEDLPLTLCGEGVGVEEGELDVCAALVCLRR